MKRVRLILISLFLYTVTATVFSISINSDLIDTAYAVVGCEGCDGIWVPCSTGGECCQSANSTANDCHGGTNNCCPE